jgi:hypothetical protein
MRILTVIALFAAAGACSGSPSEGSTATLDISVAGLSGVPAAITVTGRDGSNFVITESSTLGNLAAGWYLIRSSPVTSGIQIFAATPESVQVFLKRGAESTAVFTYALASGSMAVAVSGLPGGVNANISVSGAGYLHVVTSPETLNGLPAGSYTVTANTVVNGSTTYGGTPFTQTIVVPASSTAPNASVAYSAMTGQLEISVNGLPGGTNPSVLVTGPFGYSHAITASGAVTLLSLPLGDYHVAADSVLAGAVAYFPAAAAQNVTLNAGTPSVPATVSYVLSDLTIDGLYITQAVQTYTNTVPLVAGRDGFLRVFVKASRPNHWMPSVRVRWYMQSSLVRTDTIRAPGTSVPVAIDEGAMGASWNLPVPGTLIQPGLNVVADVDPSNVVAESDETNNYFPVNGTPVWQFVYQVPPARVILVPLIIADGGPSGLSAGNVESFMTFTDKIHPIPGHVATLHAPVSLLALPLQPDDANGAWITILSELATMRIIEHRGQDEHYYGVAHLPYTGGIIGIGYLGYPVAMGSDSSTRDQIVAHELGHNWGRSHSPCGNPSGPDPQYPYANGSIGAYGFDVPTRTSYSPATHYDIMSYCRPYWVSDYTYTGVLDFIMGIFTVPFMRAARSAPEEPSLVVWGHMRGGEMVLEPALEIATGAKVPSGGGAYTIEALDAGGATLFSYAFDGDAVADEPGGARNFSFAIPLSHFDISRLAALQVRGAGGTVRVVAGAAAPSGLVARLRGGRAELRWNSAAYPMALVRDAATGEVLSIGRGGAVRLGARATDLVVTLSNGVRSTTEAVRAQ